MYLGECEISLLGVYGSKDYFKQREQLEQRARGKKHISVCKIAYKSVRLKKNRCKGNVITDEVGKVQKRQIMKFLKQTEILNLNFFSQSLPQANFKKKNPQKRQYKYIKNRKKLLIHFKMSTSSQMLVMFLNTMFQDLKYHNKDIEQAC